MNEISGANKFKFDSFPKQLKSKKQKPPNRMKLPMNVTSSLPEPAQI